MTPRESERDLLEKVARLVRRAGPARGVSIGVGDDAAVVAVEGEAVLTCDALVEGTHFTLATHRPRDLGHKSLAVNLSDIAAMGARPRYCLVSLILRDDMGSRFIESFYDGLLGLAGRWAMAVVGGNIARTSGPVAIDVTAIGQVPGGGAVALGGARPGDVIMVTGTLGDSAAGLALLGLDSCGGGRLVEKAVSAHLRPEPRVDEGLVLAGTVPGPTAMTDISDGLSVEIEIICRASGTGAIIDAGLLPLSEACRHAARLTGADPVSWAVAGGEDYELVFTAGERDASHVAEAVTRATGTGVTTVGTVCGPGHGLKLVAGGDEVPLPRGYQHFGGR